jgi:hypothetical protein
MIHWLLAASTSLFLSDIDVRLEPHEQTELILYCMTSWREGNKTRNVHLGSSKKMGAEEALQKARKMKAEAIHVN